MSGVVLLDGALGTLLEAAGLDLPPPLWSARAVRDRPEAVAAAHRAYALAGATVHTAATFRTTPRAAGDRADDLTATAVALARGAVPTDHHVAGSLAPVEDCWHPERSPGDADRHHRDQAARLVAAGVDLLLAETFAHPGEAVAATRAAVAEAGGRPVWTALTPGWDGRLLTPHALGAAAARVAREGASVVLLNCGPAARLSPWIAALAEAAARAGVAWGVYANAGGATDGLQAGDADAGERWQALVRAWIGAGAAVIGGCCGTTPWHIAQARAAAPQQFLPPGHFPPGKA